MSRGEPATLHGQFERHAARRPDAIAIATPGGSWTYAEVWRRARRIAAAVGHGAGPVGGRVALLLADPLEAVSAMLGVLAAGRVMVPLEPRWPALRLAQVILEAGAGLLITEESLRTIAGQLPAPASLVLSDGLPEEEEALPEVPPGSLAYVLFTSGSTGPPKGVMQSHENALAHLRAYSRALGIRAEDGLTLVSSFAVDAAVMDIWGALLNGAALHVLDVRATAPEEIARWMRAQGTTILHATPTVFRHLAGSLPEGEVLSGLRCVVLGGEPARRRDLELFRARFPRGAALVNGYGPTESTVSLQCLLDHDSAVEGELLPLGRPTEGMEVVLLDEGEIGLRSSRVALGYWGREDLTARAFAPLAGGERLYRTGDLGRRREDGSFEFVGRGDLRMKSRGWWIDLAAVEARLLQHPAVREVIVLPCEDERPGACLLPKEGCAPAEEALRELLARDLPEAAMATRFAVLEDWPLTASGKVDLAELRARLARAGDSTAGGPWEETEAAIARMVSRLLGIRPPGRHESLTVLGGDSLLATRLAAAIEEELGAAVTARDVLDHPTAAGLSRVVRAARGQGIPLRVPRALSAAPVPVGGDQDEQHLRAAPVPVGGGQGEHRGRSLRAAGAALVPASLHQRRYLVRLGREARAAFQLAFLTEIRGPLDVGALTESVRAVVRRHEALRTAFTPRGGGYVQQVAPAARLDVPFVDLSGSAPEPGLARLSAEALAPFDLSRPPLLRATLARCAADHHVLVWAAHHLVTDGWSRRVIEDELQTFYRSAVAGAPAPLGELPFQYADYSRWLEQASAPDGAFGPQLEYWRATLRGFEPLRFPAVEPEGPARTTRLQLTAECSARLERLGRANFATPFMTYLAAFALALSRHAGRADLVVTTDVAGRAPLETEALVGLFTNVVPIRLDAAGAPSLEEMVARAREAVVGALEHQLLPFAAVAEALWPGQLHRYDELFPAAFFVEAPEAGAEAPGWLSTRELPTGATSRDLILVVRPSPEGTQVELTSRARAGARTAEALIAELRAVLERSGR